MASKKQSVKKVSKKVENKEVSMDVFKLKDARIDYGQYEVIGNGESVSVIGNFDIMDKEQVLCPLYKFAEEKKVKKMKIRKTRSSGTIEDFGPQRFCPECGALLSRVYVPWKGMYSMENPLTWGRHTMSAIKEEEKRQTDLANEDIRKNRWIRTKFGPEYIEETVERETYRCPIHGEVEAAPYEKSMEPMSMLDLKEIYRSLKGKDAQWLHEHSAELKKLYAEHSDFGSGGNVDDALHGSHHKLPFIYDEEERLVDYDADKVQERWDAPLETEKETKLSKEEVYLLGYASKVLAFSPSKVYEKASKATNVRDDIREYVMDLANLFAEVGLVHPKVLRWKNHRMMADCIKRDRQVLNQDWEYESRLHECRLEACYF